MFVVTVYEDTGTGQCPVWLYIHFHAPFLAMAMIEQAHHCSSGLTKTLDFDTFDIMFLHIPVSRCNCLTPACLLSGLQGLRHDVPYLTSGFATISDAVLFLKETA